MQFSRMRPLGVTIIAILVAVGGVFTIINGLLLLGISPGYTIFALVLGVLSFVLAWGLWTLKPWAFWLTVVLQVIGLVQAILGLTQGQGNSVISLIFPIVVLIYLLWDRNVRAAFRT